MNNIKIIDGIVNDNLYDEFHVQKGFDLFSHLCNGILIEDFLAVANILCPSFIDIEGYVFLADLFEERDEEAVIELYRLKEQYKDKKKIEQYVNSKSIGEFFLSQDSPSLDNQNILDEFCNIINYFWSRRLKELYPNKKFNIEFGNEIMGELGLTVTLYQI